MHGLIFHEVSAQKFHLSGLAELCIFPSQTLIELLSLVVLLCVCVCVCVRMCVRAVLCLFSFAVIRLCGHP